MHFWTELSLAQSGQYCIITKVYLLLDLSINIQHFNAFSITHSLRDSSLCTHLGEINVIKKLQKLKIPHNKSHLRGEFSQYHVFMGIFWHICVFICPFQCKKLQKRNRFSIQALCMRRALDVLSTGNSTSVPT